MSTVISLQSAGYHGPPPLTPTNWVAAWTLDPATLALIVITGGCYLALMSRLRTRGERWSPARAVAFFGLGLGSLLLVTLSFIGVYKDTLFWVRAVQNVVLLMVTPMFLALGAPVRLVLAALSERRRERVSTLLHSRLARLLTFPAVVSGAFVATPFLLYFTPWYEATLRNAAVDDLTRVFLVLVGFVYYWTRLRTDPVPRAYPYLVSVWISFAEVIFDGALGLTLMLGSHLVAGDYYRALARPWGPSLHTDQAFGGGALWLLGDLAGLPFLGAVTRLMIREDEQHAAEVDRRLDAQAAAEAAARAATAADAGSAPGPGDPPPGSEPQMMRPWWETDPVFSRRYGRGSPGPR